MQLRTRKDSLIPSPLRRIVCFPMRDQPRWDYHLFLFVVAGFFRQFLKIMAKITVKKSAGQSFEVTVEAASATSHNVTLADEYYQKLTAGRVTPEVLIEKSFQFLLARESNTMILARFDLPLIGRYFPDYEQTIGGML